MTEGQAPLQIVPDIVFRSADRFRNEPVLSSLSDAGVETFGYAELKTSMLVAAAAITERGLRPGARVLMLIPGGPKCGAIFFGILEAGLVAVPLLPDTPLEMVRNLAERIDAAAIVVNEPIERFSSMLDSCTVIFVEELLLPGEAAVSPKRPVPDDLALLAMTSGSTGASKAVALSHANLVANVEAALKQRRAKLGDALLSMLPSAHLFELVTGFLCPIACGARIVYAGTLLPNRLIEAIREEHITHALVVPALLDILYQEIRDTMIAAGVVGPHVQGQTLEQTAHRLKLELNEQEREKLRAFLSKQISTTFSTLIVGGAALAAEWRTICGVMGLELDVGYGLTEAGPMVTGGHASDCPPGSVGRPLSTVQVRISDDGEVLVRSPSVMMGYYGDPEGTIKALEDGWLHTGDIGRIDSDGFLFITGRIKDAIVTKAGDTVSPEEIEPYYKHPLFMDVCIVPATGADGNDVPVLLVVPKNPDIEDRAIETAFKAQRSAAPSRFWVERAQCVAGPFPRNAMGKIQRRALAKSLGLEKEDDDARY